MVNIAFDHFTPGLSLLGGPMIGLSATLLILGGALFGIGWGIGRFCPGPAGTALGAGFMPAAWFVAAMLAGMGLHGRYLSTLFVSKERRQ